MRVFLLRGEACDGIYHLSEKEKRYIFRVLRLAINDTFTAKDSNENYYKAFLFDENSLTLESTDTPEDTLLDSLSSYKGPFAPITMMLSVLKGKKSEIAVRALTEIGVKRIVLMETEFTQEPLSKHQEERLRLIIREAVQQSGSKEPELIGPVQFEEALFLAEGKLLILHQAKLAETKSLHSALSGLDSSSPVTLMIGPEGGFSEKECEKAIAKGADAVLLNTNILRAETAAIYTASAVQSYLHI